MTELEKIKERWNITPNTGGCSDCNTQELAAEDIARLVKAVEYLINELKSYKDSDILCGSQVKGVMEHPQEYFDEEMKTVNSILKGE